MVLHLQFAAQMYSLTLSLLWLASNNCHLWGSSSRCDSNHAYYEFPRSKFWTSMLHSFRCNFFWTEFSVYNSFSSSSLKIFSEISSIRKECSETLQNRILVSVCTKSGSWNNLTRQCRAVFSHMAILSVIIYVMNVRDQTRQASVTNSGRLCDYSCKFVHEPKKVKSTNSGQR